MADVVVRMSAEDADMVRKWQEAKRGVTEFTQELDRSARRGRQAGQTIQQEMGSALVSKLAATASATVVLQMGIDKMTEAWTEYIRVQAEAAAGMRSVINASAKLSQLASSPEELKQVHQRRDELVTKYNITPEKAVEVMFNAKSAGLDKSEEDMVAKGSILGDDPQASSAYMGSIKQIYKGKVDPKQAYNIALQAAADAPNLEMKDVTAGLPELMNPGDTLGLGIEEVAAIFNQTSARHGGGTQTATANKRLLAKLSMQEDYAGKGLAGLEKFVNLPEDQWKDIIGEDTEPRAAARALREKMADIKTSAQDYKATAASTGTADDALNKQIAVHFSLPENRTTFEADRKKKERELAEQKQFGEETLQQDTAVDAERKRLADSKTGFVGWGGAATARGMAYYLDQSPEDIRKASVVGQQMAERPWETFSYTAARAAENIGFPIGQGDRKTIESVENRMNQRMNESTEQTDANAILLRIEANTANKRVQIERDGAGAPLPPGAAQLND